MSIYVEIEMRTSMEHLWERTQVPQLHKLWDLRFTDIEYLPRPDESQPQRFLYATRIGFGLNISGEGETVGARETKDGSRSSALKFWSHDPKSLIREGSGYWKYIPSERGMRFLTWYDYRTRFGLLGRAFDSFVFRPLMGWATAWSFDRLRLWLEKDIHPAISMERSVIHAISRIAIALVWIYHGLVPKVLFQHRDEAAMLSAAGIDTGSIPALLRTLGFCEIAFGIAFLLMWRARSMFLLNAALMLVALAAVSVQSPQYLSAAFNPVSLNSLMIAVSVIGYLVSRDLPSAARCKRQKPEGET